MDIIIKKAIEGGYPETWEHISYSYNFCERKSLILDPLFWQSLGKVINNREWILQEGWVNYALNFHKINLTSGWDSAIAYLTNLIKS